jgi:hypothetical protein
MRTSSNIVKMKTFTFAILTLLASALAAPAVVWKSSQPSHERVLHSSDDLSVADLMMGVLGDSEAPQASSLSAVVFLVGKGEDGSEQLTELASTGKLPRTSQRYEEATAVHHHVSGIEGPATVVREAARSANPGQQQHRVLVVSLDELSSKLASLGAPAEVEIDTAGAMQQQQGTKSKSATKRARELAQANVYIVNVDSARDSITEVDGTIISAISNKSVGAVVLAGVRSADEVKHERYLAAKRRMSVMEKEGNKILDARRRRLQEDAEDGAAENANDDLAGVYYVSMTPNILAGLLFGFLFLTITYVGITCMGAIQGGDTFTDKMPSIGREA